MPLDRRVSDMALFGILRSLLTRLRRKVPTVWLNLSSLPYLMSLLKTQEHIIYRVCALSEKKLEAPVIPKCFSRVLQPRMYHLSSVRPLLIALRTPVTRPLFTDFFSPPCVFAIYSDSKLRKFGFCTINILQLYSQLIPQISAYKAQANGSL